MPETVKTSKRRYDSSGRQARAAETRAAVLGAARTAFLADGFARTTVPGVASAAGVSVETVYKAFSNKAGLVKAVFDVAMAGDDEPIPFLQREFVQRNMAEPDPRKKLAAYGEHVVDVDLLPIGAPRRDWRTTTVGDGGVVVRHHELQKVIEMTDAFARDLQLYAG